MDVWQTQGRLAVERDICPLRAWLGLVPSILSMAHFGEKRNIALLDAVMGYHIRRISRGE